MFPCLKCTVASALKKRGGREGVPGANGELVRGWDLKFDLKGCMDDKTQEKAGKDIVEVFHCGSAIEC